MNDKGGGPGTRESEGTDVREKKAQRRGQMGRNGRATSGRFDRDAPKLDTARKFVQVLLELMTRNRTHTTMRVRAVDNRRYGRWCYPMEYSCHGGNGHHMFCLEIASKSLQLNLRLFPDKESEYCMSLLIGIDHN